MEYRKFKQGDRVRQKSGGPVMEVVRYVEKNQPGVSSPSSIHDVECVWYDEKEERHREVFDQRTLLKLETDHGLFSIKD